MSFYRSPQKILARSFRISPRKTAFFAVKTDFHFIFCEIKNSYAEKNCCFRSQNRYPKPSFTVFVEIKNSDLEKSAVFSQNFMSFYRSQKIILASSFRVSRQKTAFFAAKTDSHFIFSEINNSYAEKNCCFGIK
jgi:hypothetical protein